MAKKRKVDGVLPYLPLDWRAWSTSGTVRSMTRVQKSIYLDILIQQWIQGSVPRDAWRLSQDVIANYEATLNLLRKHSEILVCSECGRSWTEVDCECGQSKVVGRCHNEKLKNFSVDAISGLSLGTTEPNITLKEPNTTQPSAADAAVVHTSESKAGQYCLVCTKIKPVPPLVICGECTVSGWFVDSTGQLDRAQRTASGN